MILKIRKNYNRKKKRKKEFREKVVLVRHLDTAIRNVVDNRSRRRSALIC